MLTKRENPTQDATKQKERRSEKDVEETREKKEKKRKRERETGDACVSTCMEKHETDRKKERRAMGIQKEKEGNQKKEKLKKKI